MNDVPEGVYFPDPFVWECWILCKEYECFRKCVEEVRQE